MSGTRRRMRIIALLMVAAAAQGCRTMPASLPEAPQGITIVSTHAPDASLDAESFYEPNVGQWTYDSLDQDGRRRSSSIVIERSSTSRFKSSWVDVRAEELSTYWRLDEDGNVIMPATIDHDENALSLFDPPLEVFPASLASGEQQTFESTMRVVDSDNPGKQRETGTAHRWMTYAAIQVIRTPLGDLEAHRIEVEFRADLRNAKVEQLDTLWFTKEHGLIASHTRKTVRILGTFEDTEHRTLLIREVTK